MVDDCCDASHAARHGAVVRHSVGHHLAFCHRGHSLTGAEGVSDVRRTPTAQPVSVRTLKELPASVHTLKVLLGSAARSLAHRMRRCTAHRLFRRHMVLELGRCGPRCQRMNRSRCARRGFLQCVVEAGNEKDRKCWLPRVHCCAVEGERSHRGDR